MISVTSRYTSAGQQLVEFRLAGQLIEDDRGGPAPHQRVHRCDGQGQPGRPPVGREVDHGGRLTRGEEHVPAEVAVDQLSLQAHRPEHRQQAPQLPGQRNGSGGRAESGEHLFTGLHESIL